MASGAFPQTFPGLGHASSSAQSIEEFEAQMAAAKQLPPASSPSGDSYHTPPPSQARPSQQPSNASPQLQAGRAWSSESVASFNNLCLKNAVANGFEYAQVRLVPPGWSVELKFGFGSLSGEGARRLTAEYSQAEGKPRPLFQEFSLGANYSMECILPADRPGEPFGGRDLLFNSKKAAKANAAREAVRWLRAQDRMPKKGHPTKKKIKAAQLAAAYSAAAQFSASASADPGPLPTPTPIGGDVAIAMAGASNSNAASASDSDGSSGSPDQKDRTPGEQVMLLCSKLGCAQPIYKITPDPRVPSMWSGAAYFPHDPAIAPPGQPIGEVHNIYGKKKAREEVAKRVLKHLKAKRVERQKVAESALAGAGAGAPMVPQV
ncbi:hypothetical protein MPH_04289 [Macrophomina phaseolina MS6]|uniref:Double-stranded RNA-binding protein n=1 Tax=Macrophomina phaseolina (strain MS6) TaxID=1126212 RepID=K2S0L1_MACPH|nr:hypothetical protein MPH_04289 [Macrophomina phaseolina MS6]